MAGSSWNWSKSQVGQLGFGKLGTTIMLSCVCSIFHRGVQYIGILGFPPPPTRHGKNIKRVKIKKMGGGESKRKRRKRKTKEQLKLKG
jgi:hypothetical protein